LTPGREGEPAAVLDLINKAHWCRAQFLSVGQASTIDHTSKGEEFQA